MVIPTFFVIVLPLALFNIFHNRAPICILAKDDLYFFDSEIMEFDTANSKKAKHSCTNGCVAYHEITDMQYIPSIRKLRSSRLILKGSGFEVTVYDVGRWLVSNIKMKQKMPHDRKNILPSESSTPRARDGIWNEIWEANESGRIESIFDEHTEVLRIISDESCDMLDIVVCRNGIEICFNIDKDTVYMYVPSADIDQTFSLNDFDHVENVCEQLRELVVWGADRS